MILWLRLSWPHWHPPIQHSQIQGRVRRCQIWLFHQPQLVSEEMEEVHGFVYAVESSTAFSLTRECWPQVFLGFGTGSTCQTICFCCRGCCMSFYFSPNRVGLGVFSHSKGLGANFSFAVPWGRSLFPPKRFCGGFPQLFTFASQSFQFFFPQQR